MSTDDVEQPRSAGADRGLDLSSLLQGFVGEGSNQESGSPDLSVLGSLVGELIGQGMSKSEPAGQPIPDAAGLAEGMGISPSAAQAALALVMGSLLRGDFAVGGKSGGLTGQLARLGDQPLDEEAVKATGLPEQLSRSTGLDLPKAVQTVQQILEMLRKVTKPLGSAAASKPSTSTAKKRRRKATSSTGSKQKPKKKTSSSTSSKAKPKKTTSPSAKSKPKKTTGSTRPKAKPKKTSASSSAKPRKTTAKRASAK